MNDRVRLTLAAALLSSVALPAFAQQAGPQPGDPAPQAQPADTSQADARKKAADSGEMAARRSRADSAPTG